MMINTKRIYRGGIMRKVVEDLICLMLYFGVIYAIMLSI